MSAGEGGVNVTEGVSIPPVKLLFNRVSVGCWGGCHGGLERGEQESQNFLFGIEEMETTVGS